MHTTPTTTKRGPYKPTINPVLLARSAKRKLAQRLKRLPKKYLVCEFTHGAYRVVVDQQDPLERMVRVTLLKDGLVVDTVGLYREDVLEPEYGTFEVTKRDMQQPDFNPLDPIYEDGYFG